MKIRILNHHSRSALDLVLAIKHQGEVAEVVTDTSDFCKSKDNKVKYLGLVANYLRCLLPVEGEQGVVIFHDDMLLVRGGIEKMKHILKFAPEGHIVSFYEPDNSRFDKAREKGHHVLTSLLHLWPQCHWFPFSMYEPFAKFVKETQDNPPEGALGEDRLVEMYSKKNKHVMYFILPSLVQHEGFTRSTFGIPATCGGRLRESSDFDPFFDVTKVDWVKEFANPFKSE